MIASINSATTKLMPKKEKTKILKLKSQPNKKVKINNKKLQSIEEDMRDIMNKIETHITTSFETPCDNEK